MANNSLVWVMAGSYNRKKAINLCGVVWIIFCTKTGLHLTGTFWEKSNLASSYRAGLLGLCALHLMARAVVEYYKVKGWSAVLCCNNNHALELLSHHQHCIRPSANCADIRCSLKTTKPLLNSAFQYVHVHGHMDQYLKWEQLTLTQQLNCVCNTLAKKSITTVIIHGYHDRQSQLLPKEDVALVVWGTKITGNILPPLQFHASKDMARQYLATHKKDKWSNERFNAVGWEHLDLALKNKADMYKMWQSKQHSDFCGTRVQVGRYSSEPLLDKRCPNCGRRETSAHLMLCSNDDCTRLLVENVDELTTWMSQDNKTDPEILYWIPKYILMRGDKPLSMMGFMSPQFKALANSQDLIEWRDFTEGHISTHFYAIQTFHLTMSSSYLNEED
jgi:hypothetical protein